jgi:hypothetical protein
VLAVAPRVICLDEPTAGVAQREAEAFGPLIKRSIKFADPPNGDGDVVLATARASLCVLGWSSSRSRAQACFRSTQRQPSASSSPRTPASRPRHDA